jgi:hypothetical protein
MSDWMSNIRPSLMAQIPEFSDKKPGCIARARWRPVGLSDLPPIEQKTLDGWGTQFHLRWGGDFGGRLKRLSSSRVRARL